MSSTKKIIIAIIILIIVAIGGATIYKVIKSHNNKLITAMEAKIIGEAKKCWAEEKCSNDTITLKELYEKKYLDPVIDPITKEYINEDSTITKNDNEVKFKKAE